jgi:hypothetical protein
MYVTEKSISSNVLGPFMPKTKNICIKQSYYYLKISFLNLNRKFHIQIKISNSINVLNN